MTLSRSTNLLATPGRSVRPSLRLAAEVAARQLPWVAYADLFVTEDCNHRCDYCFVKEKQPCAMSQRVARDSVDFMLRASHNTEVLRFLFFGGEPLLEWEFLQDFVAHANWRARHFGKRCSFDMTSNGTLLDENRCRYLQHAGIRYLLSIDGSKPRHDRHRHMLCGESSYDAVMERLPIMKRYQPWQGARMTLTPETVGSAFEDVKHLHARGINQFIIGPATGMHWSGAALSTYEAQMLEIAQLYRELKAKKAPFRMTMFEKDCEADAGKFKDVWGCGAGNGRICISVTGELYGCAKILGVDGLRGTHKLGDVWNGITNLKDRLELLSVKPDDRPQCLSCDHRDDCAGGCPATNYEATGSIFKPAPLDCALMPIVRRVRATLSENGDEEDRENVEAAG